MFATQTWHQSAPRCHLASGGRVMTEDAESQASAGQTGEISVLYAAAIRSSWCLSQQKATVAALLFPGYLWLSFTHPPVRRVSSALPGRVLHQEHERGGNAGQWGSGWLPGRGEERLAARASQRHQHHLGAGPWWPRAPAHQQPQGRVRLLCGFMPLLLVAACVMVFWFHVRMSS